MNRIHRVVWNAAANTWVVASELAKGRKKASGVCGVLAAIAVCAVTPNVAMAVDYTTTVVAQGSQSVALNDDTVTTSGDSEYGLLAIDAGTQLDTRNTSLSTSGALAHGAVAVDGGSISLDGGSIKTSGANANGLIASDAGSTVTAMGVIVETSGLEGGNGLASFGASAQLGGVINLAGHSSVSTHATNAYGLRALDAGSQITSQQTTVLTSGDSAHGVVVMNAGSINLQDDSIETTGNGSAGLVASGSGSVVKADAVQIQTKGEDVTGAGAYGVDVEQGASIALTGGSSVSTQGEIASGLRVNGASSQLVADQTTVNTTGAKAYGAIAQGGASLTLGSDTIVETVGENAHGLVAMDADSNIDATGVNITTKGAKADGLLLGSSSATLTDSAVHAEHAGITLSAKDLVAPTKNAVQISGGTVTSVSGDAIYADAGTNTVTLSHSAQITGGNGVALNVVNPRTTVSLLADDNVVLNGDVQASALSKANVSLGNGSTLNGASRHGTDFNIDATSTWNITGNSDVQSLTLAGTAAFTEKVGYKSLVTHGDLIGNDGTVVVNTLLNEGGALSNQFTDRVLVEGNASGTIYLKVMGSSGGALTDTNRNGVMEANEGISLAQVAGLSSTDAFKLADGYVAVGPWRYDLVAHESGSSDADQRVVAGAGNGFWDYRLQNAYVSPTDPADSGEPTGTEEPTDSSTSPIVPDQNRPQVIPQVPSYLTLYPALYSYGMRNIATLHDRLGELHQDNRSGHNPPDEFFARIYGGNYKYKSNLGFSGFGYDFTQNDRTVQIGGAWLRTGNDNATWRFGLYGYTGTSHVKPEAVDGVSRMRVGTGGIAATATYEHANGFYVDAVVSRNFYNTVVDSAERGTNAADLKTRGWSYSLEGGYPFDLSGGLLIEPQAQVVYQSLRTRRTVDIDGLTVAPGASNMWIGRLGARLSKTYKTETGNRWTPWASLDVLKGSNGTPHVDLASESWGMQESFATGKYGSTVKAATGVTGALSDTVSLHGDAGYQTQIGKAGEEGWSINLGMRWNF